ncbi:Zn-dependent peptidase ImmA (M78 family) [Agrobacterium tumefaciens]|uniref:ImmA/IrrE family metallo-endopeptidase n=1 Tax=Agrobacterium tumefaciens TaxID=358 RepID=UPI000DCF855B|nr:Zn-dependent peptidase ImmA (M78 family) [Agrobacterium tumefaciens]MBP2519469.1 Zn-dependent peptidase ImmA (M78 family) [Agrobacterium tumefaciens]MBP2578204.1 Zn-dependent peptidase ImmA (M78 family) [Agrobacterium tumefaciens]MBP2596150.1 Zn-dependent peptidase ImmA (M78 family) [Agrobacterium tumefaciens]
MNSTAKGNSLEDALFDYLIDQQERGHRVYGLFSPELCKIRKKPKYDCPERKKPVEFDVVIEAYREGRQTPFSYVVFECKNYRSGIPESRVTDFSDKMGRIFGHSVKGVLVVSSRLQSGAENIARSRSMGIVKFNETGVDVVAERRHQYAVESAFIKSQIFEEEHRVKALKFSAYFDGKFFSSVGQLLECFEHDAADKSSDGSDKVSVPYMSTDDIRAFASEILAGIGYKAGPVDLAEVCAAMALELKFSRKNIFDDDGTLILGSANFDRHSIEINAHNNDFRERFTIGHEIGHFCLGHGRYLRSETVIEQDLLVDAEVAESFNFARLELQANLFASEIILPDQVFRLAAEVGCKRLKMRDIGFGYVYVDDKPWNYQPYNELISDLSQYFRVSKQATEIRLKKLGLVNDQRRYGDTSSVNLIGEIFASIRTDNR